LKQAAAGLHLNAPAASGWPLDGGLVAEARQVLFRAACGTEGSFRLWSPGFYDTILFHKGQLANMRAYVRDNPRRLAAKRAA